MLSDLVGLGASNPEKLDLINIDPTKEQGLAIAGNLQNAPAAFDLASLVNQFSASELNKQLERMLPGYGKLRDSTTGAIQNLVSGDATDAERNSMRRLAAEQNWSGGTPGSDFGNYKELGLNFNRMQQRTQLGLSSAANWLAATKAPQFDFTKMFQDPNTRWNQMFSQAQANLPIRSFNNWVDTLPSTQNRAIGEFMNWIENTGRSIVSSYAGGIAGGGSGGGGQQGQQVSQTAGYSMFSGGGGGFSANPSPGGSGYSSDFYSSGPQ